MLQLVCPIKSGNDFEKDFVIHSFRSVVNTPSMTPERKNKLPLFAKSPLVHVKQCLNLYIPKIHSYSLFSCVRNASAARQSVLMRAGNITTKNFERILKPRIEPLNFRERTPYWVASTEGFHHTIGV